MSDKQRADHVQAKYWNGFITRTEIQKIFDEYGQAMTAQATAIQKLDAVISCIADKLGITTEVVNEWVKGKIAEAAKKAEEAPTQAPNADSQDKQPEGSSIILAS